MKRCLDIRPCLYSRDRFVLRPPALWLHHVPPDRRTGRTARVLLGCHDVGIEMTVEEARLLADAIDELLAAPPGGSASGAGDVP